jgi:hypothetical protein
MAARREHLDELIARIEAQPLDADWLLALRLLGELREGYDARESAGVEPKRGAPPTTLGSQKLGVVHYLKLRAAGGTEKDAAATAAAAWGITPGRLRTLAREHGDAVSEVVRTFTLEDIESFRAPLVAENKRFTAK